MPWGDLGYFCCGRMSPEYSLLCFPPPSRRQTAGIRKSLGLGDSTQPPSFLSPPSLARFLSAPSPRVHASQIRRCAWQAGDLQFSGSHFQKHPRAAQSGSVLSQAQDHKVPPEAWLTLRDTRSRRPQEPEPSRAVRGREGEARVKRALTFCRAQSTKPSWWAVGWPLPPPALDAHSSELGFGSHAFSSSWLRRLCPAQAVTTGLCNSNAAVQVVPTKRCPEPNSP